jgi:succinyl-diaminopimelate desuccinylase
MRRLTETEKQRVTGLLADLVRIRSAIASTEQANRDRAEEHVAEFLTVHLETMGMKVDRQEVYPGRPNLMAHWPGQGSGKKLVLSAHMDTVTTEGMTIDPLGAEIREGRLYGRGACDTKASIAALLTALALAAEGDQLPSDQLCFVATVSEETGCDGAAALIKSGFRADAAIVGEPTGCQLVNAHKAPLWLEIETHGRPAHASMPHQGVNAIDRMARVIEFVHGSWSDYIAVNRHSLLGSSTSCITLITGGSKINIVPASCRAHLDGRFVPGQSMEAVLADFSRMLAERLGGEEAFTIVSQRTHPGLDCPPDAPVARKLLDLCRAANGQDGPRGVNYFADTGPFSEAGIASVLFGPGDIAQAHTADEFIDLEQLYQATEIILTLVTDHTGRSIIEEA